MSNQVPPGDSILRTKIRIPRMRPQWVVRQRLLDRLQGGIWSKLTLVCAQAGFGKTTLLADWSRHAGRPVAWLTLDEGDNAPERFLRYLHAAFQAALPGVGKAATAMLAANQPLQPREFVLSLINELDEEGLPAVLVLDDYHSIHETAIHDTTNFLLENLPECLHLVISSRSDPLLPLPRLRAHGEMNEIRGPDLRFTAQESAEFLGQVMGLNLSDEDVNLLEARTEGWIAGLQLAALSMRDRSDSRQFIQALTGSNRFILDYLIEEVLRRQPVEIQEFLIKTSILERFCADLCQAVTGLAEIRPLLDRLEQANLFIQSLDEDSCWYRYHTLFADLLRYQLKKTQPDQVAALHRRAAAWLEANHLPFEAVDHTLAAGDLAQAACLVEFTGENLLNEEFANRLLDWIDILPGEVYRARPRLPLLYAWGLISTNRFPAAEPHLQAVEQILATWHPAEVDPLLRNRPENIHAQVLGTPAIIASTLGNLENTIRLANLALEHLAPEDNLYSALQMGLGVAYHLSGNLQGASQAFMLAFEHAKKTGETAVCLTALYNVGDIQLIQGMLHRAKDTFNNGLDLAASLSPSASPLSGMAFCGLAGIYYEWDDLRAALECSQQAVTLCDQWGNTNIQVASYGIKSRVLDALGRHSESSVEIAKASELAQSRNITPNIQQLLTAYRLENWLNTGQIEPAWQGLQTNPLEAEEAIPYIFQYEGLVRARVMEEVGRAHKDRPLVEKALDLLSNLNAVFQESLAEDWAIRGLVLQTSGLSGLGETEKALACLEQALSRTVTEGYIRLYVDCGHPMVSLLERYVSLETAPSTLKQYAGRLLTHFKPSTHSPAAISTGPGQKQGLVEPLSERELQILRMLASGLGNQEIATRLTLAPGTVKRHLHNIFGKLGVVTRTQAIAKAREHHLL